VDALYVMEIAGVMVGMMSMKRVALDDKTSVSQQLVPDDFPVLAAEGVRLVINNRPDSELPEHLQSAEASRLAQRHGMHYLYMPMTFPGLSAALVDSFAAAVAQSGGPVHAHCRSGTRSAALWALGKLRGRAEDRSAVNDMLLAKGIDIKDALAWLDRQ
jgi:uncharacterized protein (TIGR01244 family)